MAQRPPSPDADVFGDDLDEVLGRANPNPNRIGCPPRDTLVELARRTRPMDDPAYQHLLKCSPCYREVRALQTQAAPARRAPRVAPAAWMALAAALILMVLVGGVLWQRSGQQPGLAAPVVARNEPPAVVAPPPASTVTPPVRTELDLRKFSVFRSGEAQRPPQEVVTLPAGLVDLTLLLPVGSEPGAYEVQLLDSDLKSIAGGRGTGEVRNFVTTVRVSLDLTKAPKGAHQLAVRRQDDQWRLFAARIE
ncbi:hypothetical protein [Luteitalea sp.]|uniref:hypothetical protein n=1 Tax=Luteitalea sp. TaxID=2004800 RepID=UPI0025BE8651|nr:hypothetical protein [Luteitalea sp.]